MTQAYGAIFDGKVHSTVDSFPVENPAHKRQIVGIMPMVSQEQMAAAVAAAKRAFRSWRRTSPEERAALLEQSAARIEAETESLARLLVQENGKTLKEAVRDIGVTVGLLRNAAAVGRHFYEQLAAARGSDTDLQYEPIGVVGVIIPWNSPVVLTARDVAPTLMAGNTVLLKPAPDAPLTVLRMIELIYDLWPAGVLNVVPGSIEVVGSTLIDDPDIAGLAFTGSSQTGKSILARAAQRLKQTKMELGGNDPALILDEYGLQDAAVEQIAHGSLWCTGQICFAIKRVYVPESLHDQFVAKLTERVNTHVVGDGLDPEVTMGPLNNARQFEKVTQLMANARRAGAVIHEGGTLKEDPDEGYYVKPAVVTGLSHDSELVSVEQFGPIIPVVPYRDLEQGIAWANDTDYGLRASVWGSNAEQAYEVASRLEASVVTVNAYGSPRGRHDFKGWKESGFGTWSAYGGIEHFMYLRGVIRPAG